MEEKGMSGPMKDPRDRVIRWTVSLLAIVVMSGIGINLLGAASEPQGPEAAAAAANALFAKLGCAARTRSTTFTSTPLRSVKLIRKAAIAVLLSRPAGRHGKRLAHT